MTEKHVSTASGQHWARIKRLVRRLVGGHPAEYNGDVAFLQESGLFDRDYYLRCYPDVASAGLDPIEHYVRHGVAEERDPSPWFNTAHYFKTNADVAYAGINPFRHFCEHGWAELRDPSPTFDIAWYWLTYMADQGVPGNPLAHYLAGGAGKGHEIRAAGILSPEDRERMADAASALIRSGSCDVAHLQALARVGLRIGRPDVAELALSEAAGIDPGDAGNQEQLAGVLASQEKWWLAVESLQRATALEQRPEWFFRLGEANEAMRRFGQAAEAFRNAIRLEPGHVQWHYRLGYALERDGREDAANEAYARVVSMCPKGDVARFGIGAMHQKRGLWEAARAAYEREILRSPLDGELRYRLGYACDRCYAWEKALSSYEDAIRISGKSSAHWHYRRGFVLERMQRWDESAVAYEAACALSGKPMPYWRYRQGYVLAKAGQFVRSCHAFIETQNAQTLQGQLLDASEDADGRDTKLDDYLAGFDGEQVIVELLERNNLDPDAHHSLGQCRERLRDWRGAAAAYAAAIERCSDHKPAWHYRRGFCLFMAGEYAGASDAFLGARVFRHAHGVSEKDFPAKSLGIQYSTIYAEYRESLPIRDKVILYESHIGSSVSCNPLAIFLSLVDDPAYAGYLHVWVLNDPSHAPESLRRRKNVVLVRRPSDGYFRWMATAKYLINNTGFPPYFVRREGQRFLATWHGTPLKTLGKQQQYKFLEHKRTQRAFLHATHLISPNPHTTDILLDSYDIRQIAGGTMAETGYPRIDLTLNASEVRKAEIRAALGVGGTRPVVLYAPTWRGTLETVSYDVAKVGEDIEYLSERHNCDIVFRGHHLLEKAFAINSGRMDGIVAPSDIDTNELLSVVDVLITDYSSIFFDFLPLGRPILYHTYDEEEYRRHRGMYFSMDEMPGYKCPDLETLSESLAQALQGKLHDEAQHRDAVRRFCPHEDGRATQRTIDFFFRDSPGSVVPLRAAPPLRILIHGGGLKRNGITTSFLNLLSHLDPARVHVSLAVSADSLEKDKEGRALFERIPAHCAVIGRHFHPTMTLEERWLRRQHELAEEPFDGERLERIRDLYDREYLHIFDEARFDVVIAFSGYDAFWASVLGLNRRKVRKAIYLHNEMYEEYRVRYPELLRIFHDYPFYDRIVSVSPETCRDNRETLSDWLGVDPGRFICCENMQDPERILQLSREPMTTEDRAWFADGPVFVNMARLSVEKGQDRLIRAFAKINREHPQTRLLILGDGPLRGMLQALVLELGLQGRVFLPGVRANPYPYLKRGACFVLSSHHEAKTMSLIEALIVGMPFVATDIIGNRDIKKEFPGYFFDASEEGLVTGMRSFLEGRLPPADFDWRSHQETALNQFYGWVLGEVETRTAVAAN